LPATGYQPWAKIPLERKNGIIVVMIGWPCTVRASHGYMLLATSPGKKYYRKAKMVYEQS